MKYQLKKHLFSWQKECLDLWFHNQGKGIINVVTGAGKTILALGAIARLESALFSEQATKLKIKIIVPKIFLAHQWLQNLQEDMDIDKQAIGIYTGAHKDPPTRKYMIYVVNSARYTLSEHLLDDFHKGHSILLIADECHHYSSPENSRIFDFISQIKTEHQLSHYYALGLSATPDTVNFKEKLVPALGPEIFKYGFTEALNANVINSFAIFNIKLKFTLTVERLYLDLSKQLTLALDILMQNCPFLRNLTNAAFFCCIRATSSKS